MKTLLLTISLAAAGATAALAQGTIAVYNTGASYLTYTDAYSSYSSADNGVYVTTGTGVGKASTGTDKYYYALLVQPYNATNTDNPLQAGYTLAMMATNALVAGGLSGSGGSGGSAVANWTAPTTSANNSGGLDNYILVGWSANEGTTWLEVSNELATGAWNYIGGPGSGLFGVSALGSGYPGGGTGSPPPAAPNIFGTGINAGGLTGGITLFGLTVPEPSTIALAGLGVSALVDFRRRNSCK